MTTSRKHDTAQANAPPWPLPRALLAALSLLAALALGALLALTLTDGAPWAALAGWSAGALSSPVSRCGPASGAKAQSCPWARAGRRPCWPC